MKTMRKPDRATVERLISEEAKKLSAQVADVWGTSRKDKAVRARRAAILRIIEETGCSERGLSRVWGVSARCIRNSLQGFRQIGAYDEATLVRMTWQYGDRRARMIAAGQDPKTQADIAVWRNLRGGRAA